MLLVEPGEALASALPAALRALTAYRMDSASCGPEAVSMLTDRAGVGYDLVVTPWSTAATSGREILHALRRAGGDRTAVLSWLPRAQLSQLPAAMEAGAAAVLVEPVTAELLGEELGRLIGSRRPVTVAPQINCTFQCIVGGNSAMRATMQLVEEVAPSEANVLVLGATGTGKELIARAIHCKSPRRTGPFVAVNCSAIPEGLIESELFGHRKGAFTGAVADHRGVFESANGGTLLLDEIGDLSPAVQVRLLRAIQERRVHPVGADGSRPVDVRIVAATHQPLLERIAEGAFREDLYYRLAVVELELPPLRERREDILSLAEHFLRRSANRVGRAVPRLSTDVVRVLLAHSWPGNVRELENAMERAMLLSRGDQIELTVLPPRLRRPADPAPTDDPFPTLAELEQRQIARVLAHTEGRRGEAARLLGIDRKTLYRKLEALGLSDLPDGPAPDAASACPTDPA